MVGRLKIWELLTESGREGDNCMRIGSGIRPQRTNELNPNKNLLPTAYLFSKSIMASTIIGSTIIGSTIIGSTIIASRRPNRKSHRD